MAAKNRQTTRTKTKPSQVKPNDRGSPLEQAITSAAVIALAVGSLCFAFAWSINVVIIAFGLSLCAFWFLRLRLFDRLLFALEEVTQVDLDQDGRIADGHLIVKNANQARSKTALQVQADTHNGRLRELEDFLAKAYRIGTSESAMGVKPSDRAKYLECRDTLMRLGIGQWKSDSPRAGWRLAVSEDVARGIIADHVTEI